MASPTRSFGLWSFLKSCHLSQEVWQVLESGLMLVKWDLGWEKRTDTGFRATVGIKIQKHMIYSQLVCSLEQSRGHLEPDPEC